MPTANPGHVAHCLPQPYNSTHKCGPPRPQCLRVHWFLLHHFPLPGCPRVAQGEAPLGNMGENRTASNRRLRQSMAKLCLSFIGTLNIIFSNKIGPSMTQLQYLRGSDVQVS